MEYGIDADDLKEIRNVFSSHPAVKEVIIFGSRAMGNHKPGSDIDLVVIGEDLSFNEILELKNDLDLLGTLYRFDLQNLKSINDQVVLEHINRVGKTFYSI